jgi:glutamine synthetase
VGITIEAFHKECGKGQFEMPIRFSNVQKMVEDYYVTKMIIKKHFASRGMVVSYLPKPAADIGIGAHAHFSLWND